MNSINVIDLSQSSWTLACHRPFIWMFDHSERTPEFSIPARVPGSNLTALRDAKIIEDWNAGINSRNCEWAEHRHWEFHTELAALPADMPVTLEAEGLDYSGWILVDYKIVATFQGTLIRHRFDLTEKLGDGKAHRLSIVFDEAPREQGQIGYSSRSHIFKPRFAYSWDWVPRIVPTGIWDSLRLVTGKIAGEVVRVQTILNDDHESGRLSVVVNAADAANVHITLGEQSWDREVEAGESTIDLDLPKVDLWWPNDQGPQNVYAISVEIDGQKRFESTTGFKHVRWLPCEGAKPTAAPWICEVNGKKIFLQGVNWTPISPDYASVTREQYENLIDLYKQMGANLLRVWGGAFLEKEIFYELCDRAGILVWQEFPLSSSGVENAAPTDPAVIETLCTIATDYIRRRGHHACKLVWCGGNELFGKAASNDPVHATPTGGPPHDLSHPAIAAMAKVVEREDPGTRFLPTSSSGPRFSFDPKERGQGLHEDTHGPWNWQGDFASWREYWEANDSLFCSEFGFPSTSPLDILEKYRGNCDLWPPTRDNIYWMHSASWWLPKRYMNDLKDLGAEDGIKKLVELTQSTQAQMLSTAVQIMKSRFPACGGILIWMGHDCFPCPTNTSIIDFLGRPKPAYHVLTKVFRS
jgi:beta-mannosidase